MHTGTLYGLKGGFDCSILYSDLTNDSGAAWITSSRQPERVKASDETLVVILIVIRLRTAAPFVSVFDSKGTFEFKLPQTQY